MALSRIYKQFTAQDKAIVPFIAHKQYNFDSASAELNRISYFTSSYTSESVSLYSTASSVYGGDIINNIKYHQIDHLFYRNYRKEIEKKNDFLGWLKQHRELGEKANILSLPVGLYGYEVRKNSLYFSSSRFEVTDDSYGNLIISGTDVNQYPKTQECVFRVGPIDGFKRYDLAVWDDYARVSDGGLVQWEAPFGEWGGGQVVMGPNSNHQNTIKEFYRRGHKNPDSPPTYTSALPQNKRTQTKDGISQSFWENYPNNGVNSGYFPFDTDDSILNNIIYYENISFTQSADLGPPRHLHPTIIFNSATSSFISSSHTSLWNFNKSKEFSISFWIKPEATGSDGNILNTEKRYILAKSGLSEEIGTQISASVVTSDAIEVENESNAFPFEIYHMSNSLYFARSDGDEIHTISGEITSSDGTCQVTSHICCQYSASYMEIWFNGTKISSDTSTLHKPTSNSSKLFIGSKGTLTTVDSSSVNNNKYFNGKLNDINIFTRTFSATQIQNISSSINGSPYIGNIFYQSGFAVITHPNYSDIFSSYSGHDGSIKTLQFQGSHLIYEHEFQCHIEEHEFNYSTNQSLLANDEDNPYRLEGFTSESFFSPYITTIGLYNEAYELLAIAKLAQPVRCSDNTDTTFVVRYDT